MKLKKKAQGDKPIKNDHLKVNLVDIDQGEDPKEDGLMPIEDVKKVHIGDQISQTTQIGSNFSPEEETEIIIILKGNIVFHHLDLDPTIKSVSKRNRKDGEERRRVIEDEVGKLLKSDFIQEIKYLTWSANIVMVKKQSTK